MNTTCETKKKAWRKYLKLLNSKVKQVVTKINFQDNDTEPYWTWNGENLVVTDQFIKILSK